MVSGPRNGAAKVPNAVPIAPPAGAAASAAAKPAALGIRLRSPDLTKAVVPLTGSGGFPYRASSKDVCFLLP